MGFILKLKKLQIILIRKQDFDAKRTLEDGVSNARSSQSRMEQEQKRYGDSFEHVYRKYRRSAEPKFLSG